MNSLWPSASRFSWLQRRCISRACLTVDDLVGCLARRSVRPYSMYSLPFRRTERPLLSSWPRKAPQFPYRTVSRASSSQRVATTFEQLPKDYKDEDGISFREGPMSKEEVATIFGKGVDTNTASRILRVLHGRRVAGTLEDPSFSTTSAWHRRAQDIALEWLRENAPVDEGRSAGLRAEFELQQMEADVIGDAERIGIYKNKPRGTEKIAKTAKGSQSVYGNSGLDYIRAAKERELDEKDTKKECQSQADEIRWNTGALEKTNPRSSVELRRPGQNPKLKYYLERANVLPNTPPEMSVIERLFPSFIVTLGIVGASIAFAYSYNPPTQSARLWPDVPPAAATIMSLITANVLVWFAWRFPPALRILNKYFITVPGYPRAVSIIGSTFSHMATSHLVMNMVVLFFVGTRLHDEVGRANFLAIYLSSGAIGSFTSLASWVIKGNFISSSLGASGALTGIIAAYLWFNNDQSLRLFGSETLPGMPAITLLVLMIAVEVFSLNWKHKTPITSDHWSHLGGYATGILSAQMVKTKARRSKELETERRKHLGVVDRGGGNRNVR